MKYPGYYAQNKTGVISNITHPLTIMDSALRVYAHPQILKMVESVHGPDFVPFTSLRSHRIFICF